MGEEVVWNIHEPWKTLDEWQKKYIETDGNCFLLCGRQVGKSTAMSIKAGLRAATKPKRSILMIALTERQAYEIFFKTLIYLEANYPSLIKKGKDKPTKHEINLKNGSVIMCHPAGLNGEGLRGFTITDLFVDEAARMSREVFVSVTPMLSVTGGTMDIASTPCGKQGYFYECSLDPNFNKFYVSAEDCPRHEKEFLEREKASKSEKEYAQEYLAMFLDDLQRIFPDRLLQKCLVLKRQEYIDKNFNHYLGVDIARLGEDESSFEILRKINREKFQHVESIVTRKTLTTDTERKIIELEARYHFKEIDIDAGSGTLGVSVFDHLLDEDSTKRKVVAINNRARSLDRDETKRTKIFKEDLYNNLVSLMERGVIELLDDDEVYASLASIQYEYVVKEGEPTKMRIFGRKGEGGDHIAEGLVRAAWAASKDKSLNIWVRY